VGGTLFGFKIHLKDSDITYGADLNYIMVDSNPYGVDDVAQGMFHLGVMATDDLELYGSLGYGNEGSNSGTGYGLGVVWGFSESLSLTYEYRVFDLGSYDLKSGSLGLMVRF
jgi:opacity protein-like surface antigen